MTEPGGHDDRSDAELVDACNAGDAGAFEQLYRRHRDWAVRVAYRFTGEREGALDVMQEAFAYLLTRFPGFRLTAALPSFLYVVLKHAALSRKRRQRREVPADGASDTPEPHAAHNSGAHDEASRRLGAAVERLPDGQREVLLMRVVDGMTTAEIAGALSVRPGTVKSRLHHALAALRADPDARGYFTSEDVFEAPY